MNTPISDVCVKNFALFYDDPNLTCCLVVVPSAPTDVVSDFPFFPCRDFFHGFFRWC